MGLFWRRYLRHNLSIHVMDDDKVIPTQRPRIILDAGGLVDETRVTLELYREDLDPETVSEQLGSGPSSAHKRGERRLERGVTLIEIIVVVVYLAIILSSTIYGAQTHGWLGLFFGLALSICVPIGIIALLSWFEKWLWVGVPSLPACRNGRCHAEDYHVEFQGGDLIYICRCGLSFRKHQRRFFEEKEDGSQKPYLRWRSFRGWFPET